MLRPASTGLATAFFRLYLLDALACAPDRPAALLARIAGSGLPFAAGAFGRALQSLLDGGHLTPASDGRVALTPLGAAERVAERERWAAALPVVQGLLGERTAPRPTRIGEAPAAAYAAPVADAYLDRVLLATLRERVSAAREGGAAVAVVLVEVAVRHPSEAQRRAMIYRAIRASLGGTATLFGADVAAFRYGDAGIALVAPAAALQVDRLAARASERLDELLRTMTATVRAFGGARWTVRVGAAGWTADLGTTIALLRAAQAALAEAGRASDAA
ncbi:MAG TPA: hypothetical protein VM070_08675 [Candidatus Saccharimonadales bacterium]|nr:hypothetical protein [Candidatus Saccharimonadales bacterium]